MNLEDAQGRLARWSLRLQEFEYELHYLPGRSHHRADMVSRLQSMDPSLCDPDSPVDTDVPCFFVSHRDDQTLLSVYDLREHQRCDPAHQAFLPHWVVASLWTWMIMG
jgi:hypothetical protein